MLYVIYAVVNTETLPLSVSFRILVIVFKLMHSSYIRSHDTVYDNTCESCIAYIGLGYVVCSVCCINTAPFIIPLTLSRTKSKQPIAYLGYN